MVTINVRRWALTADHWLTPPDTCTRRHKQETYVLLDVNAACQKMHYYSGRNPFHMFTIRHTIWSVICTPTMAPLAQSGSSLFVCTPPACVLCVQYTAAKLSHAVKLSPTWKTRKRKQFSGKIIDLARLYKSTWRLLIVITFVWFCSTSAIYFCCCFFPPLEKIFLSHFSGFR